MATKIRMEFLSDGFAALINSAGVASLVQSKAEAIAAAAGINFEAHLVSLNYGGSPRPGAVIRPTGEEGKQEEAESKVLTKAIWAGQ